MLEDLKWFSVLIPFVWLSCNNKPTDERIPEVTEAFKQLDLPQVNADSAFEFVRKQVDFGPRVPGTAAHAACASWIEGKMQSYQLETMIQHGMVTTYDGKQFDLKNIISTYRPELKRRILLCAHWDTRPFADRDDDNSDKTFDGANDGASGVAVLIEVARLIGQTKPEIGVDFIFFDLEDYGDAQGQTENSWCLGAQYWAKNKHVAGYNPIYGILLDMVGGHNPVFPKEGTSMKYASGIVNKVWSLARNLGYTMFINNISPETTDDHLYINTIAGIPCIDIVHYNLTKMDYMDCHHRHCDDLTNIDPLTLKIAGHVLMEVIHQEAVKG
ncbi:MAG: M28 family peptidase [Bacteroidia bacterium]|nr:M28 family peptidase [Bacteroidia bacterium]MCZ2276748.1 M28 family peptidase [Bacteroidia bacterium]